MRYPDVPREFNVANYFLDSSPPGRTALVTDTGPISYGRLSALSVRVAAVLRAQGVGRGDRVLLALRDGWEFVASWYGVQRIGGITAEAHAFLRPADYRYYLDYVTPAMVVADDVTLEPLRAAGARRLLVAGVPVDQLREGEISLEQALARAPHHLEPVTTTADDEAIWKFTTGSTGTPKACRLAARSALLSFHWYARGVLDLRPEDVILPVPKLFFGYARDLTALFPFGVGAAGVIFAGRSTADRIFELIAIHRPSILVNVPTMMKAMIEHPAAREYDLGCLRLVTSAGEALPPQLHRRWLDTFGVEVLDGIGSSEAYHIYVSNRPGQVRPGSLGQAVPGYRVRVVDPGGVPLPAGEIGRLEITGEAVATGYWRSPEQSAEAFPAPHTLRSTDLASRDEDGFFYYQGRADDLLKVGGRFVAPAEVERCLLSHPAVAECAVTGFEVTGLVRPRAFVVAAGPVTPQELRQHCRTRLAQYKWPRDIRFVAQLPRTASGKVDRRALKTLV